MTQKTRFVGDIHGKYLGFLTVARGAQGAPVVQVGDWGFGFGPYGEASWVDEEVLVNYPNVKMIRGNHDNPAEAAKSSHFIPDGTVDGDVMFVGGAGSIDKAWRTEGVDWWPDEELEYGELLDLIDKYEQVKPRIMVTHECPDWLADDVMIPLVNGVRNFPSRTRTAFDTMWSIHKPEIWIFGHWHKNMNRKFEGCTFICLNELSYVDIEV